MKCRFSVYSLPCLQSRKDKGKPSQKKDVPSVEHGAGEENTTPKLCLLLLLAYGALPEDLLPFP